MSSGKSSQFSFLKVSKILSLSFVLVANLVPIKVAILGCLFAFCVTSTTISRKLSKRTILPPIKKVSPFVSEAAKASSISPRGFPPLRRCILTFNVSVSWIVPTFILILFDVLGSRRTIFPLSSIFNRCHCSYRLSAYPPSIQNLKHSLKSSLVKFW